MTILFNSQSGKKLLAYLFAHPEQSYYVRELAILINTDPGNLSRNLHRMEKEGILNSQVRGNERFYSLNKQCPFFQELKKIVGKTIGLEKNLKDLIEPYKGITLAFIHGSYAKGTEKKNSDIDMVLVGDFNQEEFTRKTATLESKLGRQINFTSYTVEEFDKEGNRPGSFLGLVLKDMVVMLKGNLNAG